MAAHFSELHCQVPHVGKILRGCPSHQCSNLSFVNRLVVHTLLRSQLHPDDHLFLFWQRLHIFLHATQQDGLQLFLKSLHLLNSHSSFISKLVQKLIHIVKSSGIQQVEQSIHLPHVILYWCTSQEKQPIDGHASYHCTGGSIDGLHAVGFINDDGVPGDVLEYILVFEYDFIRCQDDMWFHNLGELLWLLLLLLLFLVGVGLFGRETTTMALSATCKRLFFLFLLLLFLFILLLFFLLDSKARSTVKQLILLNNLTISSRSRVYHHIHISPHLNFPLPVTQCGQWSHHKEGTLALTKLTLVL